MSKAVKIKDFPDYYITDAGDVYSLERAYVSALKATSKALDVAIDTLKEIGNNANCTNEAFGRKIADKALEKISEIIGGK